MKTERFYIVAAGKRPNIRRKYSYKNICNKLKQWFSPRLVKRPVFIVISMAIVVIFLSLHNYMSNFVYVVKINDREVGIIENAKDINRFIDDLTDRCSELYGMPIESDNRISLVKKYRPDSIPETEMVRNAIRQRISFITDAYMVIANGKPIVPISEEDHLEVILDNLKTYYDEDEVQVIDTFIIGSLTVEPCVVSPDKVVKPEEVVKLLVNDQRDQEFHASVSSNYLFYNAFKIIPDDLGGPEPILGENYSFSENKETNNLTAANSAVIVKTLEELTVTENIPFPVEYIYDEEMWIVQREIITLGQKGTKEIIYYITKENGVEVDRIKISEAVLEEPVAQIEKHGTARVPSIGSGRFVWPVEGGGEVTPGRGFSRWHTGVDIGAPTGANILAADNGIVWFSGYGRSQGNYIIIYHGQYWTLYLHNDINLVSKGDEVVQGEIIALVGSTGNSSGPHLHFEIRMDDGTGEWHTYYQHEPIDPLRFFYP